MEIIPTVFHCISRSYNVEVQLFIFDIITSDIIPNLTSVCYPSRIRINPLGFVSESAPHKEVDHVRLGCRVGLASISPQDTTEILRFLMQLDAPGAEVVRAVDAAMAWLVQNRLTGIRIEKISAPNEEFLRHTADFDKVVLNDPQATPLWARHYEIGTNRPIFAGRDGVKKYTLAEIERERRSGTPWYGNWPQKLIEREYPVWKEKIGQP